MPLQIEFGAECHISKRPYTKFRWRPGSDARYKSTIICQEVAKQKNVCQVCLLDLKHNLPVQVRDQLSNAVVEDIPESDVGVEYQLALKQSRGELGAQFKDGDLNEDDNLARLTRTTPYYKVRRPSLSTNTCLASCWLWLIMCCTCHTEHIRCHETTCNCSHSSTCTNTAIPVVFTHCMLMLLQLPHTSSRFAHLQPS